MIKLKIMSENFRVIKIRIILRLKETMQQTVPILQCVSYKYDPILFLLVINLQNLLLKKALINLKTCVKEKQSIISSSILTVLIYKNKFAKFSIRIRCICILRVYTRFTSSIHAICLYCKILNQSLLQYKLNKSCALK